MYDTVLQKQKFAVFRLCPTSSCSASKNFGCDNTYEEYFMISVSIGRRCRNSTSRRRSVIVGTVKNMLLAIVRINIIVSMMVLKKK